MMREYAKAAGWVALVLLLGTGVSYAVRGIADLGLWIPLTLGLGLGVWWLVVFRVEAVGVLASRRARQGANSVVYTLAVAAIAVLLQALVAGNDHSFDLSKGKTFTLADETVKTLSALESPVKILAFYAPDQRGEFEDLLKRAKKVNPSKFDYEFVNLNKDPLIAEQYGVRSLGTAVAVAGDKSESFNGPKEEDLLNAISKVSRGSRKNVYFLEGHQERSVNSSDPAGASKLKAGLEGAGFSVRGLNFATAGAKVPEDCAALVLAGPRSDLLAPELQALSDYLARGGRVIAAVDPRVQAPALLAWLAKAGIKLDEDIIIDLNPFNQLAGGSPVAPVIQDFDGSHPASKDLRALQGQAIFPQARSLELSGLPDGATGSVLARTFPTAFGWTGSGNRAPARPGPGDKKGPLALAAAVEAPAKAFGGEDNAPKARLVVLGSSQLLANSLVVVFNNQDLVVNSLRWLADDEKRIALAPKPKTNSPLIMDAGSLRMLWWSFILLSLACIAAGVGVWILRRREAV
jgi:ABC-type uncharacterized transport system involved in gliding motility auxiliary subunit